LPRTKEGLVVDATAGELNRRIGYDFRAGFVALARLAVNVATLNPTALADAAELAAAIRREPDSLETRAWVLVRRALGLAMARVAVDAFRGEGRAVGSPQGLVATLDLSLEDERVTLTPRFFDFPAELPLVGKLREPLRRWLEGCGVEPEAAARACHDLGARFTAALDQEWGRRPEDYAPLKATLDTPFTRGSERERAWIAYRAHLDAQVDEEIFGESFGLRAVYVPLRAYYEEPSPGRGPRTRRVVVDLEAEVRRWLARDDRNDAVRVVCGGPGSGKSSFAKHLVARLAREGTRRLVFIPLHRFEPAKDLIAAVGRYVGLARLLPHNPLDPQQGEPGPLLLVFDGLDELAMQGQSGQEAAVDLVAQAQRALATLNALAARVRVLICGRELVVQQNRHAFELAQILHVLPYAAAPARDDREIDAKLADDQRDAWWDAYGRARGEPLAGMPAELRHLDLDEITTQPLLNYLLALSRKRGKLDLAAAANLNEVYDDLLAAVWERRWDEGRRLPDVQKLEPDEFKRVIEDIALAAWHAGEVRAVPAGAVHAACKRDGLVDKLASFQKGAKAGAVSLLAAFYVRQAGHSAARESTFEFTHKSFGEFLVARRLVRGVQRVAEGLALREGDGERSWSEREALAHWAELTGPASIDHDLLAFVRREVTREEAEVVGCWQGRLVHLLGFACRHDWPMERLTDEGSTFARQRQRARNAEETLLALLHACAVRTQQPSRVEWPSPVSFGELLRRLQPQRRWPANAVALDCLGWLDISRQELTFADLYRANLESCILEHAGLRGAVLERANLSSSDLNYAKIYLANLREANLAGVSMKSTSFALSSLQDAKFGGANWQEANFEGADLGGTDIEAEITQKIRAERSERLSGLIFTRDPFYENRY
jgi:uncharacterized protein YjbI with pentapeptide repeats